MLTLHQSPASPFVRKVVVLLHETGQLGEVTLKQATGTPLEPGSLPVDINPLGKIPTLERPDGCTLYDSRVICRYLAERAPKGPRLYPEAPRLWEVLTLEATAEGILDAAVGMRYEVALRPEERQSSEWLEAQWAKIARSLDALESRWMGHLAGPLCMGQIATGCALGYLDFRHDARNWRQGRPALADWQARFAERPSMKATVPG
ncbi:glutathione S-transferase family protein [Pararhodobacter sp.]|uniref:glutathione S-transferase family protein n=1 Tax=Pararhodobacter sp. TaxID=2127056 RepID=UPI003FA78075